jgi:hypothetical protein
VSLPLLRMTGFAVLLLTARPAAAFDDLTGTYQGSIRCAYANTVTSDRVTADATLYIDDANDGNAFAYWNNSGLTFRLAVLSPSSPDSGQLGGPDCAMAPATGGSVLRAFVKAKAGSEKASLRGELIATNVGASSHFVQVCRVSLKRSSTKLPFPIPSCP